MDGEKKSGLPGFLQGPQKHFTPLYVMGGFILIVEAILIVGVARTSGNAQTALIVLTGVILVLVLIALFALVWSRPENLYSPSEYGETTNAPEFIAAMRRQVAVEKAREGERTGQQAHSDGQGAASDSSQHEGKQHTDTPSLVEIKAKTRSEWEREYLGEISSDQPDLAKAEQAFHHLQAEELDAAAKMRNEAVYWVVRHSKGDAAALQRLKNLHEKAQGVPELLADAYFWLGVALQNTGGWVRALDAFKASFDSAESEKQMATAVQSIAGVLIRLGRPDEARQTLLQTLSHMTDREAVAICYSGLADYHEHRKETRLQALAIEKALEYDAENLKLRFAAAMAYSSANLHDLSLLHYETILQVSPRYPYALNNIGVQYNTLKMPTLAVAAHKKSIADGTTLSASNLANLYIDAGFVDDAKRVLDEAMKAEDVHKNVPISIGRVAHQQLSDEQAKERTIESAQQQQQFFLEFADAYFPSGDGVLDLAGTWRTHDGDELVMSQNEKGITGQWERYGATYSLAGQVQGRALVKVSVGRKAKDIYYSTQEIEDGQGYVSRDGRSITLLEIKAMENVFRQFHR